MSAGTPYLSGGRDPGDDARTPVSARRLTPRTLFSVLRKRSDAPEPRRELGSNVLYVAPILTAEARLAEFRGLLHRHEHYFLHAQRKYKLDFWTLQSC